MAEKGHAQLQSYEGRHEGLILLTTAKRCLPGLRSALLVEMPLHCRSLRSRMGVIRNRVLSVLTQRSCVAQVHCEPTRSREVHVLLACVLPVMKEAISTLRLAPGLCHEMRTKGTSCLVNFEHFTSQVSLALVTVVGDPNLCSFHLCPPNRTSLLSGTCALFLYA